MSAKFKAFISYKHSVNSRGHAVALERALKQFAHPLLSFPIDIFRDEKYLVPSNDLPSAIKNGLVNSEVLIFLAEKDAATSKWCQDEILYWCADLERSEQLIVVLIGGDITIDDDKKIVWGASDALPILLQNYIDYVPLYIDLRWVTRDEEKDLRNPEYKRDITAIIAKMRGTSPAELIDEDIRITRKNIQLRNYSVTVILVLLLTALVMGFIANSQRKTAVRNFAQSLAALSQSQLQTDPTIAFTVANEALSINPSNRNTYISLLRSAQYIHYSKLISRENYLSEAKFSPTGREIILIDYEKKGEVYNLQKDTSRPLNTSGILSKALYSKDGSLIVTAYYDGNIFLLDTKTLKASFLGTHTNLVFDIQFSSDEKKLLSLSDNGNAMIWDIANRTGTEIKTAGEKFSTGFFSSDGTQLLTSCNGQGTVRIWDIKTKKNTVKQIYEPVMCAVFSDNNCTIFICTEKGNLYMWKPSTNKYERLLTIKGTVQSLTKLHGDTLLAICEDGIVRMLNTTSGQVSELESLPAQIYKLDVSKDEQRLVTGDNSGGVRLWDLKNLTYKKLIGHSDGINSVKFYGNDTIITASADRTARIWNLHEAGTLDIRMDLVYYDVSTDNKWAVAGSKDSLLYIVNIQNGQRMNIPGIKGFFYTIKFSPDNKFIAVIAGDVVKIVDTKTLSLKMLKGKEGNIAAIAFSPDSKQLLTASWFADSRLWDIRNMTSLLIKGHGEWMEKVMFSNNGMMMATVSRTMVKVWQKSDLTTKEFSDKAGINDFSFSQNDQEALVVLEDSTVRLWDFNNKPVIILQLKDNPVKKASFSRDGNQVICTDNHNYLMFTDKSGKDARTYKSPFGSFGKFISSSQHYMFLDAGRRLYVYDMQNGTTSIVTDEYISPDKLQLSLDESTLVSVSDKGIKKWYLIPKDIRNRSKQVCFSWELDQTMRISLGLSEKDK